ncbi:MAG: beta-lactamase family protein [Ruminococcus sp.]|nr:beta-lactamase family protein [Ruminococcus sp.]
MNLQRLKYIDNVTEDAVRNGEVSGGTVCIVKDNVEVYRKHFGFADRERQIVPNNDTIFRMFSMSKPITAVATLILIERGMLDYNDRVSKYLDGFKNPTVLDWNTGKGVPTDRELQIRDLLTMTSGIVYPDNWSESCKQMAVLFDKNTELIKQGKGMSTVEFCNQMGKIPLVCKPNTAWVYGASADVLGAIIEVVSKKSFGEFLKDEIFTPLGMKDTGFYIPKEKYHRLAQAYYHDADGNFKIFDFMNLCITDYKEPPKFESGGAGLVSTIDDYQQFIKMLLNKGTLNGIRILGSKSIDLMRTPYLSKEIMAKKIDNDGYNYGCLVRILEDKQVAGTNASIGEFGWDGWLGTYFNVDLLENLSVMCFVQECGIGFSNLARKVRAITYGAID